ncbi:hypothetical protein Q5M47_16970, partial [Acinetobacter nosocomialis]|nr:hypothetical protein [Acinetobacter nosocomialis]
YLYFSGFEAVIKINTNKFFLNLFNFMDEFCFLDFIYFLSIDSSKKDIKLVELRIFEYICGNL